MFTSDKTEIMLYSSVQLKELSPRLSKCSGCCSGRFFGKREVFYKEAISEVSRKGKPIERWGRKAVDPTGLVIKRAIAGNGGSLVAEECKGRKKSPALVDSFGELFGLLPSKQTGQPIFFRRSGRKKESKGKQK